eukprot:Anaeramoba_flamelloidesa812460_20.p1 GENE.a812460_20~~a812460_20.p1  ORF type:complete len:209 (+),score=29.95 a812460_20:65-628(+)
MNLLNTYTILKWYDLDEEGTLQKKFSKWILKLKKFNKDPKPSQNLFDYYYSSQRVKKLPTPELHVDYIWENFVMKANSSQVYFVSHSYGGVSTIKLLLKRPKEVMGKVQKIAFTDSAHWFNEQMGSENVRYWLYKHAKNWVTSEAPLNTLIYKKKNGTVCVSAGHTLHEWTSPSSRTAIFDFYADRN